MPTQDWVLMAKLVAQIYGKADAEPFRDPVDWKSIGLFDYPQVIKKPMDLGQVKKNIESEKYTSIHEAADDVRLIWNNCMTYNADGSDFYVLAKNFSKKFEDKFLKVLKEVNIPYPHSKNVITEPSLDEKRTFAKTLYKITKEELGKVIVDIEVKCPEALTKNISEDEVEINVDNLTAEAFHDLMVYVSSCAALEGNGKKKKAGNSKLSKKQRTS